MDGKRKIAIVLAFLMLISLIASGGMVSEGYVVLTEQDENYEETNVFYTSEVTPA